jgi:hypothetical protein
LVGRFVLTAAAIALSAASTKTFEPGNLTASPIKRSVTFQERWDALYDKR